MRPLYGIHAFISLEKSVAILINNVIFRNDRIVVYGNYAHLRITIIV